MTAQKLADSIRELLAEYESAIGTMVSRITASGRHGALELEIEEMVIACNYESKVRRTGL